MNKQVMKMTVYSNETVPVLTDEQGVELSDLIQAFYKQISPEVFDVALDD